MAPLQDVPDLPENPQILDYLRRITIQLDNVHERDMGLIIGVPAEDYGEYRPLPPQLLILFSADPRQTWKTASINVPNPRANISLEEMKSLGIEHYGDLWYYRKGPYRAQVEFTDRRKIVVFGDTETHAKDMAVKAAALSTGTVMRVFVTQYFLNPENRAVTPRLVYPVRAYRYDRDENSDGRTADNAYDLRTPGAVPVEPVPAKPDMWELGHA